MLHAISGHEVDDSGLVYPEPASMLLRISEARWFDAETDAPIRAEMSDAGTVHIVGDDHPSSDGPCFGGTFSVSVEDARRVGILGDREA